MEDVNSAAPLDKASEIEAQREKAEQEFFKRVTFNIGEAIKNSGKTEAEILKQCEELGYPIPQGTMNKIKNNANGGKISLIHAAYICKALGLDLQKIVWGQPNIDDIMLSDDNSHFQSDHDTLIFDMNKNQFYGYEGDYFCYFYPTVSMEHSILKAKMSIKKNPSDGKCEVDFYLDTGKTNVITKESFIKKYSGKMVISDHLRTCYCLLTNYKIGEICFFAFRHMYFTYGKLLCRIAAVVTASAGENNRPTMHRMIISQKEISEKDLEILSPQLLLNDSDILIPQEAVERLSDKLPEEIVNAVKKSCKSYYFIPESSIRDIDAPSIDNLERCKAICTLRKHSVGKKYNKISYKSDKVLFSVLREGKEDKEEKDEKYEKGTS